MKQKARVWKKDPPKLEVYKKTVDKNQSKSTRDLSSVNKSPEVIEKVLHQGSATCS